MAVTRIKNNQITDSTITASKIASQTLVGSLFAPNLTLNSNVSIIGNLSVTGESTSISATNTYVNDPLVVFNNGYTGSLTGYDIGILVNRNLANLTGYGSVNSAWVWSEDDAAFTAIATTDTGAGFQNLSVAGFTNIIVGNVTATNATLSGNLTISGAISGGTLTGNITSASAVITNLSTGNAQITGGAITNTPISGSTGSFTTVNTSGNLDVLGETTLEIAGINSLLESSNPSTGALTVGGGVGIYKSLNVGLNTRVYGTSTLGNVTVADSSISSSANLTISSSANVKIGALTYPQVDSTAGFVMTTNGNGVIGFSSVSSAVTANVVPLGLPTDGNLTNSSPAISTFTGATTVTDAVDALNTILGKLIPPAPPAFPNGTLTVSSLSSGLRMTDFTQVNNTTTGSKQVAAGTSVTAYRRAATYSTNIFDNVGPGESGTVSVQKNSVNSGSRVMVTGTVNNGTYSDLTISNNVDYGTVSNRSTGFWFSFNASASGSVPAGWNEIFLTDTAAGTTNTVAWYYDASAPGTPVVTGTSFTPTSNVSAFSSSVPHYTSSSVWTATATANRLSGDLYPSTNTFVTGVSGGNFSTPASVTYAAAGVATPLLQNLYVASGSATFSSTVNTTNTTNVSSTGPSFSVSNSYATGSGAMNPGGNVLTINASDTTKVNENNIVVGTFGSGGSAFAVRAGGLAATATPATGSITGWTSANPLAVSDAAIVAGVLSNNTTNYSTGFFPVGPNLSGQAATQYVTFRITRAATSKFNVAVTGRFSACRVAMPGSALDTTASGVNGWIDPTVSYGGAGIPGADVGGNGSNGCGLGGVLVTGSTLTQSKTVTFGTESSTNSTSAYIYVRFTLAAGDSITALSFPNATN